MTWWRSNGGHYRSIWQPFSSVHQPSAKMVEGLIYMGLWSVMESPSGSIFGHLFAIEADGGYGAKWRTFWAMAEMAEALVFNARWRLMKRHSQQWSVIPKWRC